MTSRNADDLTPELKEKWILLRQKYITQYPKRDVILTCTYRSPEEQAELYQHGRSKEGPIITNCDGVRTISKHNVMPARAFDVAVLNCGKAVWDDDSYLPLGQIAKELGLVWGGNFKKLKDLPHFQQDPA